MIQYLVPSAFPDDGTNGHTGVALLTPASAPRIRDDPIFGAIRLPPAEHGYSLHHGIAVCSILGSRIPRWSVDATFIDQEVVMDIDRCNHRASIEDLPFHLLLVSAKQAMAQGLHLLLLFAFSLARCFLAASKRDALLRIEAAALNVGPNAVKSTSLAALAFLIARKDLLR